MRLFIVQIKDKVNEIASYATVHSSRTFAIQKVYHHHFGTDLLEDGGTWCPEINTMKLVGGMEMVISCQEGSVVRVR